MRENAEKSSQIEEKGKKKSRRSGKENPGRKERNTFHTAEKGDANMK